MIEYTPMTEKEYCDAVTQWKKEDNTHPRAVAFSYDPDTQEAHLELRNHSSISFPISFLRGFENATTSQIQNARLVSDGADIWWDDLDVQATVEYIVSRAASISMAKHVVNG